MGNRRQRGGQAPYNVLSPLSPLYPTVAKKFNLTPKSDKAKRRGERVRNVVVEKEDKERMFVRFEGWNYWVWVKKKNDPHYAVKRGWNDAGMPYTLNKGDDYKKSRV